MSKADFLASLDTEHQLLVAFYAPDDARSASVLSELGAFACRAAAHYPNLRLHRVNHKANPYLTARMLLTEVPELHYLVRPKDGEWTSYKIEIEAGGGSGSLSEFMASQGWALQMPEGGSAQRFCSPFNTCGLALGRIAEAGSILEDALPIPRWLALIVIPAIITLAGRVIIDGMYAADALVRSALRPGGGGGAQESPPGSDNKKRQ
ncbi:hypothetical protein H4R21_006065 [Coemansia helicoidea]|uniref:Uncharacterized protein n=1 Tax=Coemansia helicoidea TaxID=1286919 RepID=A0ACC1KQ35_9FUNG|nr:hypothetical protein H4R21_006065 [Coemansia helicoidea]